ncbi:MAG: hypothetical protein HS113_11215 [Verrucomicrobiales bacterium]|nr:hypothetical protein [Verrucomicrobiales bacterium]
MAGPRRQRRLDLRAGRRTVPPANGMDGKPERFWRHALTVFLACVALYFGGFWLLEHLRVRRGPWEVSFRSETNGTPLLIIRQPRFGLDGVVLAFPGAPVPPAAKPATVRFDRPERQTEVPFGRVKFFDTTFLPGTVTFDLFGHEIELLPRTLILNGQEHPWRSGERIELPAR